MSTGLLFTAVLPFTFLAFIEEVIVLHGGLVCIGVNVSSTRNWVNDGEVVDLYFFEFLPHVLKALTDAVGRISLDVVTVID